MKDYDFVKQGGAWYTYVDVETGEELKFQAKELQDLLENNPSVKEQIYKRICEFTILQYKKDSLDTDNLVVDDGVLSEE
jgi:tRNA threonylcarbamoyladenosine modification (KEOPS) complex Cgi121 subunit